MLVHGIADDNVYFAHTLQLADALFKANRPFELLPLVGLTHQVADPRMREALYKRIVYFLGRVLWS
jgi:dipeptidyl-peptidase-4